MNISRFVVLGALEALDTASGYDIIRFLEKKMIDRWTNVKKGSIYNAIKSLDNEGKIRRVSRVKTGAYPTMTLYEITVQGRESFDKMQEEAFRGLYPSFFGFKLALKFNKRRTGEEVRHYAALAIDGIEKTLSGMAVYLETLPEASVQKRSDAFFIEHDRMLLLEEKRWIQMVLEHLDVIQGGPFVGIIPEIEQA